MAETSVEQERDVLLRKAMEYLLGAGWIAEPSAPRGGFSMEHRCDDRTLRLRFEPDQGFALMHIAFRGAASPGWLFRAGEIELRLYVNGPDLLGLLCRITSSQDTLWPDVATDWIEDIIAAYPDTYAIIAKNPHRNAEPVLVQVMSNKPARVLH